MSYSYGSINRRNALFKIGVVAPLSGMTILESNTASAQDQTLEKPRYGILGQHAPEIKLDYWIDSRGNTADYSIYNQQGKWVYLYCFQDWCPGCHSHGFPALHKLSQAFPDQSAISIVAVQTVFEGFWSNTQDDVRKLQIQYDLKIPMGHDPGDPDNDHRPKTMKNYRTGGTPWTIIIQPDGRVAFNDFHINIDKFITYISENVV